MPEAQIARATAEPLLRDLFSTACGRFDRAHNHAVERNHGLPDAILLHVPDGRGWVETSSRAEIGPGSLVLLPGGIQHAYAADQRDPWTIEWIHFQGTAAPAFCRLLGAERSARVWPHAAVLHTSHPFTTVYDLMLGGCTPSNLVHASLILRTLLAELHIETMEGEAGDSETRVRQTMEWMRHHPAERTSLSALARKAGLSIPHYCALFRRLAGCAPMEHLRRLNIQRACELLDTTALPVSTIASRLGWEDPLYFSRSFRRITGVSPRTWRFKLKA